MTVQPNGTHAKDIALYFISQTVGRSTPAIIKRTIAQAKTLLQNGYTKEEIIEVIDYLINVKHAQMYSLGYVNTAINSVLKEIEEAKGIEKAKEQSEEIQKQIEEHQKEQKDEVKDTGESTKRNKDKLNRFGNESRLGKKFDFDMFEGQ